MSLIALGVMPYITASIVVQLAASLHPALIALKKEGEAGRKKMNQYTRYGAVLLCGIQGYFVAQGLEAYGASSGLQAVVDPGMVFRIGAVISLIGGTMFLLWLGEQITSRGIGNGSSLIIFSGIVAHLPVTIAGALELGRTGAISPLVILGVAVAAVALIYFIVFMERAQRRVLINYPKRQVGNRMYEGQTSFLPLKLNTSGVIPPIFASSLLLLPATAASFSPSNGSGWLGMVTAYLGHGTPLFIALYAALIIFFTFFYTAVVFNPQETADNLKKHGGFIPGIRPGDRTATFLDKVLTRITVIGALYLTVVCLFPEILSAYASASLGFGGTSLLILVTVTMDTVAQIHGHLMAHQYEGLVKRAKLRGATPGRGRR
jgi:preprotein translocase subunit SecY